MTLATFFVLNSLLLGVTFLLGFADILFGSDQKLQIKINGEQTFSAAGGVSLLDALAEKEIFLPSACGGKGTCGHCKVQVESGGGAMLPTEEGLLSSHEKRDNVRIACQLRLREDMEINVPEHMLEVAEYITEVVEMEELSDLVRRVRLKFISPATFNFQTGQYIQILIPGYEEYRAYSIASPASRNDSLNLMIRYVPKGLSTTFVHKALQIGDKIRLTGPYGDQLTIDEGVEKVVLVAGGIGIAPFAGLVEDVVIRDDIKEAKLIYGVNLENEFIKYDRFQKLADKHDKFEYIQVVAFDENWQGERGFVTDVLKKLDLDGYKVYMCGPPPMVDASLKVLAGLNIKEENVFFEAQ